MKKPAVVLYTAPAIGHLTPILELGKIIIARCPSLSVHVLLATPTVDAGSGIPSISSLSSSAPRITFHLLPPPSLPLDISTSSPSLEVLVFESSRLSNPDLRLSLETISKTHLVQAFVADFFCACAGPVVRDLGIPFFFSFPSGGGGLALFLHLLILHDDHHSLEQNRSTPLHIPGLPPITVLDFPEPCRDRKHLAYQFLLRSSREMSSSAGVIVNTFEALEHRALAAIRSGECRPGERIPIFCIGPLISSNNGVNGVGECQTWLDNQPEGSVVFLCFGSMGEFPEQQLKEIAAGLEMSGQRFLWVVRHPSRAVGPVPEPGSASLLPEGFLERAKGKGMVMNSWAPQSYILRHKSVGGFVTHCGWNSVLEAVCAGVPMVAWPLYAEQRLQKVQMTEEIGIALRLEEEGENGIVSAKEVGTKVRMLMEGEEGDAVRERTRAMRDAAMAAAATGGSSWAAFEELLQSWNCGETREFI